MCSQGASGLSLQLTPHPLSNHMLHVFLLFQLQFLLQDLQQLSLHCAQPGSTGVQLLFHRALLSNGFIPLLQYLLQGRFRPGVPQCSCRLGFWVLSMSLESQGLVTETCQLVEARRQSPLPFQARHSLADSTYRRTAWGKEQVHLPLNTLEGPKPFPQFLPSVASRGRSTRVSEEQTT